MVLDKFDSSGISISSSSLFSSSEPEDSELSSVKNSLDPSESASA